MTTKDKENVQSNKRLLTNEIGEIVEISDILFKRIENKIEVLRTIEASLDNKIGSLERLLHQAQYSKTEVDGAARRREVVSLKQRGFKTAEIAETLGLPAGEVELILGVHLQRT